MGGRRGSHILIYQFSDLLKIRNGEYLESVGRITIPAELFTVMTTAKDLIAKIYPEIANIQHKPIELFCERAILTPKND